MMGDIIILEF